MSLADDHRDVGALQRLAQIGRPPRPADEEDPRRVRRGQAERAGEGAEREAVHRHCRGHQHEGERADQRRILDAEAQEPFAEEPRDRDEHHTARSGQRDEQLLAERQAGARQRGEDGERPHQQHDQHHEQHRAPVEPLERAEVDRGGEKNEDPRDEEDRRVLLETADLVVGRQVRVGDHHAHDRHGEKPALVQHGVGQGEDRQKRDEEDGDLHVLGHEAPAEDLCQAIARRRPRQRGHRDAEDEAPRRFGRGFRGLKDKDDREGQHRRQRPQRVVHDRLPLEEHRRAAHQPRLPQKRRDHRGAGHDHDAAEDRRRLPGQARSIAQRQRRQEPAERRADQDESLHALGRVAQRPEVQREPALEQDDRHGERHRGPRGGAEIAGRVEQTEDRTDEETREEHHDDGRQPEAPGDPLRADTDEAHQRHGRHRAQRAFGPDRHQPATRRSWLCSAKRSVIPAM